MILFRRLRRGVKQISSRDWALLTLETAGVLAGILIAFQLNEWASRRNHAARHDQLMERLFEESEFGVAGLRGWRDRMRQIVDQESKFAVSLAAGRCPPDADWVAANTVHMMPAVVAPTSVYQELMGAGGLAAVENAEARRAIAEFHEGLAWVQQQVAYFRDNRIETVEPSDPRVKVRFDPTADEPEVWSFDRDSLCADQAFKNRVASATRAHLVYASYLAEAANGAIRMCAALGASMGQHCAPDTGGPLTGADAKLVDAIAAKARLAKD